ncbi:hypothetical protein [Geodermatophilus sp. SYSU D00700]
MTEHSNPGHDVIEFVMLHLGLHELTGSVPDRLEDHYMSAAQKVQALAATDTHLCLSLLADLAGHFAKTLERHAPTGTVSRVINDWAGRGWTPSVQRRGPITALPTVDKIIVDRGDRTAQDRLTPECAPPSTNTD